MREIDAYVFLSLVKDQVGDSASFSGRKPIPVA